MNYLPSNLEFRDGVAFIGETSLLDVAKEYGTPLYVYDWEHLRDNIDHHARFGTGDQYWGEVVFQREDALCISPLPGLSTHLHEGVMSPLIDWKAEAARFDWSL